MDDCKWLPPMFKWPEWDDYKSYEQELYELFKEKVIDGSIEFMGKSVQIRWYPLDNGKEEAFYHCTCKKYNSSDDRQPDPYRMIRLPWLTEIIKNHDCTYECCEEKPLVWRKKFHNKMWRYHIYFRRYLIVLEKREKYFLLISAFYVESNGYHKSLLKDSQKTENAIKR